MLVSKLEKVIESSPPIESNRCWTRIPSLPQDVSLGKDQIQLSTHSPSTTRGGWARGLEGMDGGGTTSVYQ
ncbi:hypothetical protein HanIR_Chr17g0891061 [Helianthus annuus]|nr:hypothetical protein HanIR_Chr17g0891061 [Helianthus annuus]